MKKRTLLSICFFIFLLLIPSACVQEEEDESGVKSLTSIKSGEELVIADEKEDFPTFYALSEWYGRFELVNGGGNLVKDNWFDDMVDKGEKLVDKAGNAISDTWSKLSTSFKSIGINEIKETYDSDAAAKAKFIAYLDFELSRSASFLTAIDNKDYEEINTLLDQDTKEMMDIIMVILDPGYTPKTEDKFAAMIKEFHGDEFIDIFAEDFLVEILTSRSIKQVKDGLEKERKAYLQVLKDYYAFSPYNLEIFRKKVSSNISDVNNLKAALNGDASLVAGDLSLWDKIVGGVATGISFIWGGIKSIFNKKKDRTTNLGGEGSSPWGVPDLYILKN